MSDEVQKQLAAWIDADVIAESILEHLEEQGVEPTLEHGQQVWENVLAAELHESVENTVIAIFGDVQLPEKICQDGTMAVRES